MSPSSVIAVNVIDVAPERQQELIDLLREGGEHIFGPLPGFESATILTSIDGSRVVNIASWESLEATQAARSNPEVTGFGPRLAAIGTPAAGLYRVHTASKK